MFYSLFAILARHDERTLSRSIVWDCREASLKSANGYLASLRNMSPLIKEYASRHYLVGAFDGPGFQFMSRLATQGFEPDVRIFAIQCTYSLAPMHIYKIKNATQILRHMVILIDPLHISLNANEGVMVRHHAFFSAVWKRLFPTAVPLARKPKAWRTMFLLTVIDQAYMRIREAVLQRHMLHVTHELRWLLVLLEEEIPAALDVFAVLHKAGRHEDMLHVCARLWTTFAHQNRKKYKRCMLGYIQTHLLDDPGTAPIAAALRDAMPVPCAPLATVSCADVNLYEQSVSAQFVELHHGRLRHATSTTTPADRVRMVSAYLNSAGDRLAAFAAAFPTRAAGRVKAKSLPLQILRTARVLVELLADAATPKTDAELKVRL